MLPSSKSLPIEEAGQGSSGTELAHVRRDVIRAEWARLGDKALDGVVLRYVIHRQQFEQAARYRWGGQERFHQGYDQVEQRPWEGDQQPASPDGGRRPT